MAHIAGVIYDVQKKQNKPHTKSRLLSIHMTLCGFTQSSCFTTNKC